jgi:hypothetical protein
MVVLCYCGSGTDDWENLKIGVLFVHQTAM